MLIILSTIIHVRLTHPTFHLKIHRIEQTCLFEFYYYLWNNQLTSIPVHNCSSFTLAFTIYNDLDVRYTCFFKGRKLMKKYDCILPVLVRSYLAITVLLSLPNQVVKTETKSAGQTTFSRRNMFQSLFSVKPPVKPRKGGSRPSEAICLISPDVNREIWSDRPLFLWQGKVGEIGVRLKGGNKNFWSQPVTQPGGVIYTGKPLQPGKEYEWAANNNTFVPFQIMTAQQRQRTTQELNNLENQLKGASPEDIALAKVDYFIEHKLLSDALQQVYSVEKPSTELAAVRQDILTQMCKS